MSLFRKTTHLSEILEESEKQPVTIFKYSNDCGSSARLAEKLKKEMLNTECLTFGKPEPIIYQITVQREPVLSEKIAEWFQIRHETPQIIVVEKGKAIYTASHSQIKVQDFLP